MAEAHGAHADGHGAMDIKDQTETFHGFLAATVWGCGLIGMTVALLTVAFAMNLGWWAGMAAYVAIGVGTGVMFRLSSVWWAILAVSVVLMGLGGVVTPLIVAMAS
jgi:hypothetical protein